jgi:UDP-N-acetylmuramate dehydrogenase
MASDPSGSRAVTPPVRANVCLAPFTTLELGGPAHHLVEVRDEAEAVEAIRWAHGLGQEVGILGGGSNVVVSDHGFDGTVVRMASRGIDVAKTERSIRLTAAAGEPWDDLVALAVGEGWAGLECLSGIPGLAGATPIQNVGAYGQDVSGSIVAVRVLDLRRDEALELAAPECGFAYRDSVFKREPGRFVVLAVTFALRPAGAPTVAYEELGRALAVRRVMPGLADVREAVLDLRRAKAMVLDPDGENRRSVGSFFLNPVVGLDEADALAKRAVAIGAVSHPDELPSFPAADGRVKVPAAWLVEHAGFPRGTRVGHFAISSRHALALVHFGGGSSAELVSFARAVRDAVTDRFGVELRPEPSFLGFGTRDPLTG